jgi:Uma2 family endonuclease
MAHAVKRKLGYDDLAGMPDDGLIREILDGELVVTPAPSPMHQRVSKRLQRQLEAYFEGRGLGEVFDAPLDAILGQHDVVEPDILVVTTPHRFRLEPSRAHRRWLSRSSCPPQPLGTGP